MAGKVIQEEIRLSDFRLSWEEEQASSGQNFLLFRPKWMLGKDLMKVNTKPLPANPPIATTLCLRK
jgi:hypothetical protein